MVVFDGMQVNLSNNLIGRDYSLVLMTLNSMLHNVVTLEEQQYQYPIIHIISRI